MTFNIGDSVIMTADSGKGDVFYGCENKEYTGIIRELDGQVGVDVQEEQIKHKGRNDLLWFLYDGSCPAYPGMSIRPADPVDEGKGGMLNYVKKPHHNDLVTDNGEYHRLTPKDMASLRTPSQWIEGQPIKEGHYWVENKDNSFAAITWTLPRYIPQNSSILRHCPISVLPPPPPVKEVEAYGYLEYCTQIIGDETALSIADSQEIIKGKRFYSQPVTAEVLNKYFIRKEKEYNLPSSRAKNIDEYIAQSKGYNLLFTPAALDMLGVK